MSESGRSEEKREKEKEAVEPIPVARPRRRAQIFRAHLGIIRIRGRREIL